MHLLHPGTRLRQVAVRCGALAGVPVPADALLWDDLTALRWDDLTYLLWS